MPIDLNTSVPSSARIWNYWLGGKDHYLVDEEAGAAYAEVAPQVVTMARESRAYLIRAVKFLTGEMGVRQFLDIGTGLPTHHNTHEVAQQIAPDARIVYVDNDPQVLAHARTLLYSTPEGVTDYVDADLHEPEVILKAASQTLDFTQPIALMLMGILGHIEDFEEARAIVRHLHASLPAGSYFVHYDGVDTDPGLRTAQQGYDETGAIPYVLRSPEQIAAFYEGLDLLEPGIVPCPLWRPDPGICPQSTDVYGGIAVKG
ncbi:SAM-dependent methyltransferase [Streptomyces scabiei]|nr:SAM-dependent methyltransferase [Streptomyces scabiei]MDX2531557.1 SAM-dependent methyltransferase [Streptomyces scabiei]MDX2796615.1 SAM-dependent methyltransferase [Streptomyces scabiei]MDX2855851.1 SAM-dependent methyltransferase [Streptomyces scabiei]MDX3824597.1 SAM-dependent methyltransferase [Streptomyces scabiei]